MMDRRAELKGTSDRRRRKANGVCRAVFALSTLGLVAFQEPGAKIWQLTGPEGGEGRLQIIQNLERLDPPKFSPKEKWMFEWVVSGLGRDKVGTESYRLRVRTFAQMKKETNDPAPAVTRMAMRMWDFLVRKLQMSHKDMYDDGRVHFYLAFGGQAGGEQIFDEDEEAGRTKRVNTIYIYQIQNVKDPVELAREVAHEYGHAVLPPVGGFKQPEEWGNGYLGEKLFLKHLRDEYKAGRLNSDDVCGAPLDRLDKFVQLEADALAAEVWLNGPNIDHMGGSGPLALRAYLGLALYAYEALPIEAFARSLKLTGSVSARDYAAAVMLAATERPTFALVPPKALEGKDVWVPLGKGKLTGGGVLKKSGDWALVRPLGGVLRVTNS